MPPVTHQTQPSQQPIMVHYTGSDELDKGILLCLDVDRTTEGAATTAQRTRSAYAERPNNTNNNAPIGVTAQRYKAKAGGQEVEVYPMGTKGVTIALGADVTIGGMITASANGDAGRFDAVGLPGKGSAWVRQTVTARSDTGMTGTASIAVSGGVVTLTLTGIGTAVQGLTDPRVVIVGGGPEATVTPGIYNATYATADTVTLAADSAGTAASTGTCTAVSCYVIDGNPTAEADLMDGLPSGLVQYCAPRSNAAFAPTLMSGGKHFFLGGITVASGDSTGTLADGDYPGQENHFECLGTLTTNDAKVTVTNGTFEGSLTSATGTVLALTTMEFDAAAEKAVTRWNGITHGLVTYSGAVLSSS